MNITLSSDELRAIIAETVQATVARMEKVDNLQCIYTMKSAAALLDCNEKTLRKWSKDGIIQIVAIGGRNYVTGRSLAKYMYN